MLTERLARLFDLVGVDWVLWLLIALSVLSVAVIIERAWFFRRRRVDSARLAEALLEALGRGDREGALAVAQARPSLEGNVVAAAIAALDQGPDVVEEVLESAIVRERLAYNRGLGFLATLGNNAPFIGLFGTVLGIISAFAHLAEVEQGQSRAQAIMASVSEALVATAIGLLVAIPAVMAYNHFRNALNVRAAQAEWLGRAVLAHVKGEG